MFTTPAFLRFRRALRASAPPGRSLLSLTDPHPHPLGLVNREPAYGSTSGTSRLLLHPPRRSRGPQNRRGLSKSRGSPAPHDQRDHIRPDDQGPAQPPHLLGGRRGHLNLATDGGQISYGRYLPWHRDAFLAVARHPERAWITPVPLTAHITCQSWCRSTTDPSPSPGECGLVSGPRLPRRPRPGTQRRARRRLLPPGLPGGYLILLPPPGPRRQSAHCAGGILSGPRQRFADPHPAEGIGESPERNSPTP